MNVATAYWGNGRVKQLAYHVTDVRGNKHVWQGVDGAMSVRGYECQVQKKYEKMGVRENGHAKRWKNGAMIIWCNGWIGK